MSTTIDTTTNNDAVLPGGVEIVLLPHILWAKNFITRIYASDPAESAKYLNAFLSEKADIVVNGVKTSRADFIDKEKGNELLRQGAQVTFSDTVESPEDSKLGEWGKALGLFFTVNFAQAILVEGAPRTLQQSVSMNIVVAIDPDVPRPIGRFRYFDGRRVMALNQVAGEATTKA